MEDSSQRLCRQTVVTPTMLRARQFDDIDNAFGPAWKQHAAVGENSLKNLPQRDSERLGEVYRANKLVVNQKIK
jgi:hypothetical protein